MPPIIEGWIVTNPPYGIRLASEPDVSRLYRAFRERALACRGSTVAVLHADEEFERAFALRPSKRNRLNNGPIACSLLQYRIMS
jgi:23S rRNA G2445 N2-methylase RlmL